MNENDIINIQKQWAEQVIYLGTLAANVNRAKDHATGFVNKMYAFNHSDGCVFKPTKAYKAPFRLSEKAAVSYFVGGNPDFAEDKGFAFNPWKEVLFRNEKIFCYKETALASGHYYFTDPEQNKIKVEYTFAYILTPKGEIKINLHHSSLPYSFDDT